MSTSCAPSLRTRTVSSRLELGERCAEREADDDAYGDAGAGQGVGCGRDPVGVDHGAGEAVFGGFVAELDDLAAGGVGFEQGVVQDRGEISGGGQGLCGKGRAVPLG